ncbi:hypothetical protein KA005_52400 [bacterium]|nr:hypothetical protein [bacterium]
MIKQIQLPLEKLTQDPKHHFFGYYDKCPWSYDGKYMLTMEVSFNDHFPVNEPADIGLVDLSNKNNITILAQTKAWNWQQGAMMQWSPLSPNRTIIYNDRQDNQFVSVILDITTGSKKILPRPVAAVSHSGKKALSINFARLYHTRKDYGYAGLPDPWHAELCPNNDGIYLIDLNTGKNQLIVSIHQVAHFDLDTRVPGVRHWVNHLAFNTTDTRFCFLHRYELPHMKRFGTRLFTANTDGSYLRCLWSSHVSHFDWRDNDHILAWAIQQKRSSKSSKAKMIVLRALKQNQWLYRRLKMSSFLRSRIYGGAFFLFHDTKSSENTYEIVGKNLLTEDGHCTYSPDRTWILLDTYPDVHNLRHVLLYNSKAQRCIDIGSFFSPPTLTKELRCDLHPRWSRDGKQICIDSAHEGSRQIYVLDISSIVI